MIELCGNRIVHTAQRKTNTDFQYQAGSGFWTHFYRSRCWTVWMHHYIRLSLVKYLVRTALIPQTNFYYPKTIPVADPGFPRGGHANSEGGLPIIWPIFPENYMKMKTFWLGGGTSFAPPRLATAIPWGLVGHLQFNSFNPNCDKSSFHPLGGLTDGCMK